MLKITSQYLDWFQNYYHLSEIFWQLPAFVSKNRPISYKRKQAIARKFHLNGNDYKTTQNIDLKFSAFVHHMSGLN